MSPRPDINQNIVHRDCGWRACFGQVDSAQRHLERQQIGKDDFFLFFGWFRKIRINNGKIEFDPSGKDLHAIFGYLQIGEIKKVNCAFEVPKWLEYHPHASGHNKNNKTNTIYIARETSNWNRSLPGAGTFEFNEKLVLTKEGYSRSKWILHDFFREAEISYHKESRKNGYFQSALRGQEFVIKDNEKAEEWAKSLTCRIAKDEAGSPHPLGWG